MKVCVIGLGYVGLPVASIIASHGFEVVGYDKNKKIIEALKLGHTIISEKGLDMVVRASVETGRLKAIEKLELADIYIIAVPTPKLNDNSPDLSYVSEAAAEIAEVINGGELVILESTVPVGTTEKILNIIKNNRPDLFKKNNNKVINIVHCPERILPGNTLHELVYNDRIIGGLDEEATKLANDFYKTFVKGNIYLTDAKVAELSKLTENAYRDVNIAFANELSILCEELHINIKDVIKFANKHPRVNILNPGSGVGGHCIPVDPWFIINNNEHLTKLLQTSREVNLNKTIWVSKKIQETASKIEEKIKNRKVKIALLGLSYKPNIDDLRESPSVDIAKILSQKRKYEIFVVEPNIHSLPKELENKQKLYEFNDALDKSDIAVILVSHKQFNSPSKWQEFEGIVLDFSE